jgi:hypothetical protein
MGNMGLLIELYRSSVQHTIKWLVSPSRLVQIDQSQLASASFLYTLAAIYLRRKYDIKSTGFP